MTHKGYWFVRYNVPTYESRGSAGSVATGRYIESSEVIEEHPFIWKERMGHGVASLVAWEELTGKDRDAWFESQNIKRLKEYEEEQRRFRQQNGGI